MAGESNPRQQKGANSDRGGYHITGNSIHEVGQDCTETQNNDEYQCSERAVLFYMNYFRSVASSQGLIFLLRISLRRRED
jgi:hypothetical protein